MNIPMINDAKVIFNGLVEKGLIKEWELPYENLLTRLNAAIFFVTPITNDKEGLIELWNELGKLDNFSYRLNSDKKLSKLMYRVTFNQEEKQKQLEQNENNALVEINNG